jgi:hypothetical protein
LSAKANLLHDFREEIEQGNILCIMPVPRLILGHVNGRIGNTRFYPEGTIDFAAIRIVSTPDYEWNELERRGDSNSLGWSKSAATRIKLDDYDGHALIAFPINIPWHKFLDGDHEFHKEVLHEATDIAECALDIIRFEYCRLDLPNTLPGRAGSFNNRSSFSSAIFFDPKNYESYVIGAEILTHLVSAGLGLEVDSLDEFPTLDRKEVGNIARMALSLFSQAMEANSLTSKFILSISLIEFLSSPDKFEKMQDVKKSVAAHVAKNKKHYAEILDRFEIFSHKLSEHGQQIGYRTLLVHQGERFETLIPNQSDQTKLFKELHVYIGKMIHDLIKMSDQSWNEVEEYRRNRKASILGTI